MEIILEIMEIIEHLESDSTDLRQKLFLILEEGFPFTFFLTRQADYPGRSLGSPPDF